jgi:HlyD family secretion protein
VNPRRLAAGLLLPLLLAACKPDKDPVYQGYAEGEYLRMAPEAAGRLVKLAVARGDQVKAGDLLFELDDREATIARDQAAATLNADEARLADLGKGARPEEIAVYKAQLVQAQSQLSLDQPKLKRRETLRASDMVTTEDRDSAAAAVAADQARIAEARARVAAAELAGRQDMVAAAAAVVEMNRAKLAEAERQLAERRVVAPADAVVDDTLYRLGEQVAANAAVVSLLPPGNIKIRFFMPEPVLGSVHVGDRVAISCDACGADLGATVSYIAPQAEFTPPVIYSVGTRDKLVYLIEAKPEPGAAPLHPGQPVDVRLKAP